MATQLEIKAAKDIAAALGALERIEGLLTKAQVPAVEIPRGQLVGDTNLRSVELFIRERIERVPAGDPPGAIRSAEMDSVFVEWAAARGLIPMTPRKLAVALAPLMREVFRVLRSNSVIGPDGCACVGYRGVRWREMRSEKEKGKKCRMGRGSGHRAAEATEPQR